MKKILVPVVVASLFMWSCGGSEADHSGDAHAKKSADAAQEEEPAAPVNEMADFKFHTMIANLPSPLETFHTISNVNLKIDQVQLTPTEKSGDLGTMSAKAYGYGMYVTDMGFMAYRHENQKTLTYFQTCRELAQSLGAGDVFDQTISANFEENTSNSEKFVKMMDEAFNAMDQYMVDNERFVNATEIFVGSWVESQLIATRILKGQALNEDNRAVYEGVYQQKMHASNLMNVLSEIEMEVDQEVTNAVEELMMFYAGFSGIESISQEDLAELETKLMALKEKLIA